MVEDVRRRTGEPPAQVTPMGIDVSPRRTGYSTIDLVIAGSAILISCVSLFIAVQQSWIMQKTLAASSWPLLQFSSGNTNDSRKLSIGLSIDNQGVGPAIVKRFRMIYGGKEYANPYALLRDCCGYIIRRDDPTAMEAGTPLSQPVEGRVIKVGDSIGFFRMDLAPTNEVYWKKLDAVRFKLKFDACYCSVLGDCWQSDLSSLNQKPINECPKASNSPKG